MEEFQKEKIISRCGSFYRGLVSILILFLIVITVSTILDIQSKWTETENVITVSDTGLVYAKPDLGLFTATVVTEAKTVTEAMSTNTEKMNAVIAAVKDQGVEEKDLKTISFNIYPRYEWHDKSAYYPTGERVLVGYEVRQSLQVKIRDLAKIGSVIQAATDSGANQVSDLKLTIDNQDILKAQAREEAITKAKTKAKKLAEQLGVKLVGISSFSESGEVPHFVGNEITKSLSGAGEGPTIETGENKIEVTVHITYKIK